MNKDFNNIYFSLSWKICMDNYKIQGKKIEWSLEYAATVAANILSAGYCLSFDIVEKLEYMKKEEILSFYKNIMNLISENDTYASNLIKNSKVFYANFPKEVIETSYADLIVNQMLHYITLGTFVPSNYEDKIESKILSAFNYFRKLIRLGTEDDFHNDMQNLMKSNTAFSPIQIEYIRKYLKTVEGENKKIPNIEFLTNRENKIILFTFAIDNNIEIKERKVFFETATDVLRYVAYIASTGENWVRDASAISLRKKVKNHKYTRQERRLIMELLDWTNENIANDMKRHKKEWRQIANGIHPFEVAKFSNWKAAKYEHAIKGFNVIMDNIDGKQTIASIFENAITTNNYKNLASLAKTFPGEYCNRLDKILCTVHEDKSLSTKEKNELLATFSDWIKSNADKISTPLLLRVLGHMRAREEDIINSVYTPKWKVFITDKKKSALPKTWCEAVQSACYFALTEKAKWKESMGKVYVSSSMFDYRVPTDMRDTNNSDRTLTFGSEVKWSKNSDFKRFFIWWTNNETKWNIHCANDGYISIYDESRIDNDLSCLFLDEDYKPTAAAWWNTNYRDGNWAFVFSWDITDWWIVDWNWVSEYIDCDLKKLEVNGIRYVVPNVTAYTGQKFSNQTHAMFWMMERNSLDAWEIYEPSTVKTKFDLTVESTQVVPMVYNVVEDKMIWIDRSMPKSMKINIAGSVLDTITEIWALVKRAVESQAARLSDIIYANVEARGEMVDDYKDADIIFCNEDEAIEINNELKGKDIRIILPTDMIYYTSDLMAEKC